MVFCYIMIDGVRYFVVIGFGDMLEKYSLFYDWVDMVDLKE